MDKSTASKIGYLILALLLLYFMVIRPSIARGVCYREAFRQDLHEFFSNPIESRRNKADQDRSVAKLYKECKVYNVGKFWESWLFSDMRF